MPATRVWSVLAALALTPPLLIGVASTASADQPGTIPVTEVSATSSDGNIPENTIDGDLATRWSAETVDEGNPEHITWDLGTATTVGYLGIAWRSGDQRQAFFDVAVSDDGQEWQTVVANGQSSGSETDLEPVIFDDVTTDQGVQARYVRYLGYGNSTGSGWNSITDFHAYPPHDAPHVAQLAGNVPQPDPDAKPFTKPGLTEPDGSPHPLPKPNPVTGRTLDVTDYGAEVADDDHDDTPSILAALRDAEPGDEVYLPAGVYNLDSTVPSDRSSNLALRSGVNLRGEGQNETILRSSLGADNGGGKVLRGYGVSGVVVSDLTVTSTFDGPFSEDHRDNDAGGGPQYGIFLAGAGSRPSSGVYVDRVTVERYERMGVRIADSSDVVVQRSTFRNATSVGGGGSGYGISIQGVPKQNRLGFPNDSRHNVVRDNAFEGPYLRHGVILQFFTHNNVVADNTFSGIILDAVDLHGEDEYLNEVRGNDFTGIRAAAVALGNTGGSPPSNHDASGAGNWVHGNNIKGSREGIKVHLGSPGTIVERNTITGGPANGKGVYVLNAPGTIVRNNTITRNDAEGFWAVHLATDPGDAGAGGVGAGPPIDVQITGNRIMHNAGGILIEAGEDVTLSDNLVKQNGEDIRIDIASPPPPPEGGPEPDGILQLPTDDSMIDNGKPDQTFGDASLLKWKSNASGSIQRLVYYQYAVDDLDTVSSATLEFSAKLSASNVAGAAFTFEVHGLSDDAWSEDDLTWSTAPAQVVDDATKLAEFTMVGPLEQVERVRVDVTEFVRAQPDGVATFVVVDPGGQNANVDSYSKERGADGDALRPGLRVGR